MSSQSDFQAVANVYTEKISAIEMENLMSLNAELCDKTSYLSRM